MTRRRDRTKANQAAADLLLRKPLITDRDVLSVLRLWHFGPNKTRQNVMPENVTHVCSDTLGLTRSRVGTVVLTKHTRKYPQYFALLCKFLKDCPELCQDFPFTSISTNFDYAARTHRDNNNKGVSMTKSFGAFIGGQLRYWPDDDGEGELRALRKADSLTLDTKANLALFDGARAHCVLPFLGERYSLVYFTIEGHERAPKETLDKLRTCHVSLPVPASGPWKYYTQMLGPPKGARAKSLHEFFLGKAAEKPTVKTWAKKCLASLGSEALIRVLSFLDICSTCRGASLCSCSTFSQVLDID